MLHHYNYSSPLSHFLSYHQVSETATAAADGQTTPGSGGEVCPLGTVSRYPGSGPAGTGKSFTIAAILGLKPDGAPADVQSAPTDLTTAVVNLSVHQGVTDRLSDCGRRVSGRAAPAPSRGRAPKHQQPPGCRRNGGGGSGVGGGGGGKNKRVRTIFTPEQLERLEAEFERQQYMVGPERLYLAHTLQLTEAQVKVWFQNRRIKWRKHHLELTHQRLAAIKQQQLQHQLLSGADPHASDNSDNSEHSADT